MFRGYQVCRASPIPNWNRLLNSTAPARHSIVRGHSFNTIAARQVRLDRIRLESPFKGFGGRLRTGAVPLGLLGLHCRVVPSQAASIISFLRRPSVATDNFQVSQVLAVSPSQKLAPIPLRVGAFVIDATLFCVVAVVASASGPLSFIVSTFGVSLGFWLNWLNNGQTPGKRLLGLRTVREDGKEMDAATAGLLWIPHFLNVFFCIDYLWGALNLSGNYKCIHNTASSTIVVIDDVD